MFLTTACLLSESRINPSLETEINKGRCPMSVTESDFQFLIDWHAGINPWSYHILLFRLYKLLDSGVEDESFNYIGQLYYFLPPSTPSKVFNTGSFSGVGDFTMPDRSFPNPPKVNAFIALKPVTMQFSFFNFGSLNGQVWEIETPGIDKTSGSPTFIDLKLRSATLRGDYRLSITAGYNQRFAGSDVFNRGAVPISRVK
jgi:hypothetical protein